MTAKITTEWLLTLVHGRHVNGQVVLLAEAFVTKLAGVCAMLFVHRLDVLLQVILPLEPVRTDGADVRLGAVWFFVDRGLVGLHDVGAEVVSL